MNQPATFPATGTPVYARGNPPTAAQLFHLMCWVQGGYYLATGLWPLFNIESFQAVTGPKTDLWLVRTVGVLVAAVALALLVAAWRPPSPEAAVLAAAAALGLTAIDVVYVFHRVIGPIYLLDAAAEIALVVGWMWVAARRTNERDVGRL
jgi:hypothetical protein